jgi:hypothetical protein
VNSKKTNLLEGLIVFAVMTGILLPVRLFFVAYVSDNWFGSFGLIGGVSIILITLAKKDKLGKFGQMFNRQIEKFQHGKKAKIAYGQSILFLVILGGTIFAIEAGNSEFVDLKNEIMSEYSEFSEPEHLLAQTEKIGFSEWVYGIIGLFLAIFFAFPQVAAVFAVLNEMFDGWVLHFYTVGFVEYLELFGILIYHRFAFRKKVTDVSFESSNEELSNS